MDTNKKWNREKELHREQKQKQNEKQEREQRKSKKQGQGPDQELQQDKQKELLENRKKKHSEHVFSIGSPLRSFLAIFNWKLGLWSAIAQWFPAFFAVYPAGVLPALHYATYHSLFRILWAGFFGGWTERLSQAEETRWKGYLKGVLYPSIVSNVLAYGYHIVIGNPEALRTATIAFLVSAFIYAPSTIFLISHPLTKRYFARSDSRQEHC